MELSSCEYRVEYLRAFHTPNFLLFCFVTHFASPGCSIGRPEAQTDTDDLIIERLFVDVRCFSFFLYVVTPLITVSVVLRTAKTQWRFKSKNSGRNGPRPRSGSVDLLRVEFTWVDPRIFWEKASQMMR